jgi:molybdate transport system ATP-binding protein
LDEVARLADRVVLLDAGRVRAQGSVFDLLAGLGAEKPLGAVLQATVGDIQDGLSTLLFDGGVLLAAEVGQTGKRVRVRIGADEILIAREAPKAISANNILPVTISDVRLDGVRAEVEMHCGSARLVARITAASVQRLQLKAGISAFAVIKSVIVEGG